MSSTNDQVSGQEESIAKKKEKTIKNRSRNRERKKGKEKFHPVVQSEDVSVDSTAVTNTKKKSNNHNQKKQQVKKPPFVGALYKELEKLLRYVCPITINGLPVKNLKTEPIQFLRNILDDKLNQDEIFMTFLLKPSDPDFPFDLGLLSVTLCIPQSYPNKLPSPTILVLNEDIPRGYAFNIETGFRRIVATALENRINKKRDKVDSRNIESSSKNKLLIRKGTTNDIESNDSETDSSVFDLEVIGGNDLSGMVKTLDKYLEKFLSMEKKDTIKLVKVKNNGKEQQKKHIAKSVSTNLGSSEVKELSNTTSSVKLEKYKERTEELEHFRQRLRNNYVTLLTDNTHGTTYKLVLFFKEDNLTVEFGEADEVIIEKLFIKLFVPKEYLYNPKKGLKLSVDMSNNYNIGLINSIKDTNSRLIFGKLINNISKNYDYFAQDVCRSNCKSSSRNAPEYWTVTSQLNFFVHDIQKFMNEKVDFQNWYEANKLMNCDVSVTV